MTGPTECLIVDIMTLALVAYDDKEIVIASDTKSTYTKDNKTTVRLNTEKIFQRNNKPILVIAGRYPRERVRGLLDVFMDKVLEEYQSIESAARALYLFLRRCPPLKTDSFDENDFTLDILIAGYTKDGIPQIYKLMNEQSSDIDYCQRANGNSDVIGYDGPRSHARKLLKENRKSSLRKTVFWIVDECIRLFPNDIGGKSDVRFLPRP